MNTVKYSMKPNYTNYSKAMLVLQENGFNEPVLAALEELFKNSNTSEGNQGLTSKDLDLATTKVDLKIANVQKEIVELRLATERQIADLKESTTMQIAELKESTTVQVTNVQKEIQQLKFDLELKILNVQKDIQQVKADLELKIANVEIKLQKALNMQIWKIVGLLTLLSPIYALLIGFIKKSIF